MADARTRKPDVLCISSIDWDFIWQGHQEIMSRLAASGHRVLFIENTGVRPPRFSDLPRVRQRIRNWWKGTKGFRTERPNLYVLSPILLPLPYSSLARWLNLLILRRSLHRWMKVTSFRRPIVWSFLPTPLARDLIAEVDPSLTIYYCIDDLASSSPEARRITPSEQQMFRDADLVFVTSEKLRERAARFSTRVHFFPFGVSLATFEQVRRQSPAPPADIADITHPIVGYMGGLHQWVDQELMLDLSRRMPDASFVLVGPPQVDLSRLAGAPNIHLLGMKAHADVPRYVQAFDVGVVPYLLSEYTANVYPTKLNEYLAMGKPVVATDLPEIRRFNTDHGDIVRIAADAAGFERAIRAQLGTRDDVAVQRRMSVAQENSWERRVERMQELIDEAAFARESAANGWEERFRRLYHVTRSRALQVAAGIGVLYLLLFQTPLLWWVAAPLRLAETPRPADAIVVFAGGAGESGTAGGGTEERVKQAIDLYMAGFAPRMVFSSGEVRAFKEAEVMKAVAMANGVPASAIILEEEAASTYENVAHTRQILNNNAWRRVLLVTSPYHTRRAVLTWRGVAPEIAVVPVPGESQFYSHGMGASLDQIRAILHEYGGIVQYWRKGWI